jgi:hypothetical protein
MCLVRAGCSLGLGMPVRAPHLAGGDPDGAMRMRGIAAAIHVKLISQEKWKSVLQAYAVFTGHGAPSSLINNIIFLQHQINL